jgi:hypothetical protein
MLNNLSQQIRDCLQHAEESAQRAKIECHPSRASHFAISIRMKRFGRAATAHCN